MTLAGKTVVVTGVSSGIGAAVASLAREQGATVIGLDRVVADASTVSVDLADPDSIHAAVTQLPERIDALCNVAGIPGTAPPESVLTVNLLGTRHLTELLRTRVADGAVVNVASTAGAAWPGLLGPIGELLATSSIDDGLAWYRRVAPAGSAYDFSKAALIAWTLRTGWEWRGDGPRVNAVSPGAVETSILDDFRATMGPVLDAVTDLVGRNARAEEIAPLVCFLADPASSWINATNVVVDGGFTGAMSVGAVDLAALRPPRATGGNP